MTLNEYTEKAIKTEKTINTVKVNPDLIVNVLYLFNAAGNMLDQIKKHVFYKREYSHDKFAVDYAACISALQALTLIKVVGNEEELKEEDHDQIHPRLFHALLGIATEATELSQNLYKILTHQGIDVRNLREESTDLNWYQAVMYDTMKELGHPEVSWEKDLENNIEKLRIRSESNKIESYEERKIEKELKTFNRV